LALNDLSDKEVQLEQFLCYRAFLLALTGEEDKSDALRWFLRRKKEEPSILMVK